MTRTRMPFAAVAVVIAAALAIVIATSSGNSSQATSVAPGSAISLKQTSLGKTLTDANGRTLYLFQGDKRNVSTLSAAGQAVWPPFTSATKPRALGGAIAAQIGTIKGANGSLQIAYNGHPLYYYVGDHSPGQTLGQGLNQFGARWYVLAAGGSAVVSAPSASTPTAPASGGGSSYPY